MIDRLKLERLFNREVNRFKSRTPRSLELFNKAKENMPSGVPMSWMSKWPGPYPVFVKTAIGAHFIDVDDNEYVDFCLGDTGSMAGHSPMPTVNAIESQLRNGLTAMLPSEDAIVVSQELATRFGLPLWQFTVSATDANRHVIRYCREITAKGKVVVIDRCYHGSVDESFATLDQDGNVIAREGNIGAPIALDQTTYVVEFNDLDALEAVLKRGDVSAVLMEPAMTNVGIVLPIPGYLEGVRRLTKKYGAIWIVDETHTFSVGYSGMTGFLGLNPDFLTIGKSIGGGIPAGAFGMSKEMAERIEKKVQRELIDTGGIGGTLAGNALSLAAMKATLTEVLTEENFLEMVKLGNRWADGVDQVITEFNLNWHCNRLGARAEYLFKGQAPKTGREAAAAGDFYLEQYIHLRMLNEGILLTPFHNMALMSPSTNNEDVDFHTSKFRELCSELI